MLGSGSQGVPGVSRLDLQIARASQRLVSLGRMVACEYDVNIRFLSLLKSDVEARVNTPQLSPFSYRGEFCDISMYIHDCFHILNRRISALMAW